MSDKEDVLITHIQLTRSRNNVNWMEILRIAMKHAPEETKRVLRRVLDDDKDISSSLEKLVE